MEAACRGFKDIVEELAKRGADLNMRTVRIKYLCCLVTVEIQSCQQSTKSYSMQEAGESAIHAATVKGHVGVVRVLANYGADLNMPNRV